MKTKTIQMVLFLLISIFSEKANSQDYLDLADINYAFNSDLSKTNTQFASANLKTPIVFKNNDAFITGANANLFAVNGADSNDYRFYNLTLPLGYHKVLSEKLTWDVIILNRLNSDFKNINSKHYQFGVLSTFILKKTETFKYKFGVYYNQELSGPLFVPLLGVDWKVNDKFQIFGLLPQEATVYYQSSDNIAYGFAFRGQLASYMLTDNDTSFYKKKKKNEIALFSDFYITDKIVIEVKAGYLAGTVYKKYNENEKIDWALSLFKFGDTRTIQSKVNGDGLFFNASLIYRYSITKKS